MQQALISEIEHALSGDREATRSLVRRLRAPVQVEVAHLLLRHARVRGRSAREDLEDFVQEIFACLWADQGKLLRRWAPERGRSLESYVRMITRSRALDILRSKRRNPWQAEPMDHASLEAAGATDESAQVHRIASRQALLQLQDSLRKRLNGRDWQLFISLIAEQRSVKEVSDEAGMTTAAVYQWRSRFVRSVLSGVAVEMERE